MTAKLPVSLGFRMCFEGTLFPLANADGLLKFVYLGGFALSHPSRSGIVKIGQGPLLLLRCSHAIGMQPADALGRQVTGGTI